MVLKPEYTYRGTVLKIVSNNQLIVNLDLGFNVHTEVRIKLEGIDYKIWGLVQLEMRDALVELLEANNNQFVFKSNRLRNTTHGLEAEGEMWTTWHQHYPWKDSIATRPINMSINEILLDKFGDKLLKTL